MKQSCPAKKILEGRDDEMDADLHDIEDEIADQEVDVDVNVDDEELVAEAIHFKKLQQKWVTGGYKLEAQ